MSHFSVQREKPHGIEYTTIRAHSLAEARGKAAQDE
jgi:hypothetical protein